MTPKQQRFVQEYLIDLNATQAAIRAGYSQKTAEVQGCRLLRNAKVAEAIQAGRNALNTQSAVTRERVLQRLAAIGFSDLRKLYDEQGQLRSIRELDDEVAASIAGVETEELFAGSGKEREQIGHVRKVKRWDPVKALELLGRHLGLWQEPQKPADIGPGLTVIVQQGVHVQGGEVKTVAGRVEVKLPGPQRS